MAIQFNEPFKVFRSEWEVNFILLIGGSSNGKSENQKQRNLRAYYKSWNTDLRLMFYIIEKAMKSKDRQGLSPFPNSLFNHLGDWKATIAFNFPEFGRFKKMSNFIRWPQTEFISSSWLETTSPNRLAWCLYENNEITIMDIKTKHELVVFNGAQISDTGKIKVERWFWYNIFH